MAVLRLVTRRVLPMEVMTWTRSTPSCTEVLPSRSVLRSRIGESHTARSFFLFLDLSSTSLTMMRVWQLHQDRARYAKWDMRMDMDMHIVVQVPGSSISVPEQRPGV